MFFLSLLGEVELAAAVGFAGTILFFTTSISIGLSIAMGALVSRALGRGGADGQDEARRYAINNYIFGLICAVVVVLVLWPSIPALLSALGATGRTHELATGYLRIVVPSMPLLSLGMASGGVLRATGDARRAMYIALSGGLANAVFDPLLIFGLDLGIDGAADRLGDRAGHHRGHRPLRCGAHPQHDRPVPGARLPGRLQGDRRGRRAGHPDQRGDADRLRLRHRRDRPDTATARSPATPSSGGSRRSPLPCSFPCPARSARSSVRTWAPAGSTG